ncbi:hypothetical protein CEXT_313811 [Caerostris extrusa]|uniref:Uncharacterized protein n=1 Tax=Caerostris extrusa TaxID=172846 RepID=A0AAV4QI09_CAEEX|nr:hypothetical protein CEXT_313811 [Caerostris extrusa]
MALSRFLYRSCFNGDPYPGTTKIGFSQSPPYWCTYFPRLLSLFWSVVSLYLPLKLDGVFREILRMSRYEMKYNRVWEESLRQSRDSFVF